MQTSDFLDLFLTSLGDFGFFSLLGLAAGLAFPLAWLARRQYQQAGARAGKAGTVRRQRAFLLSLIVVSAALPWLVLLLGRWHDGHQLEVTHALVLIGASLATSAHLLRRWGLLAH